MTATDYTPTTWAAALLARLGVPVSTSNVTAITAWESAEGGNWHNPDRYNPLNTTQPATGATSTNGAGVKAYTSWDQGLSATVQTLTNGLYGGILTALSQGSSADAVVSAVTRSPWGTKSIPLGSSSTAAGGVQDVLHVPSPSDLTDLPGTLSNIALKVLFVGGGALIVVLGLVRGTTAGRRASDAYGTHLKDGATLAAAV